MSAEAQWIGHPAIRGTNESLQMVLLTASLIGLQFAWGIEMTYCTPYLLKLGLSKSMTALVWVAGPLSGLVMQPFIGVVADRSRSRYGRRRPFMLGGTVIVVICMLMLGWTREIIGLFNKDAKDGTATVVLAISSIWVLDFAVNAVQASNRSLIVDTLPLAKQQAGSAWAGRMTAVGHLVGYGIGTIHLTELWGTWLGDSQFKQLIWIAILFIVSCQLLTSWAVTERVLVSRSEEARGGPWKVIRRIFKMTWNLPQRIQAICWIQFWAGIGWFSFLFYSPTWVGESYFRYEASPEELADTPDIMGEIGRIGSLALVGFSITTFLGSVIIPLIVRPPEEEEEKGQNDEEKSRWKTFVSRLDPYKPDLRQVWFAGHCLFAAAMIFAPLVRSLAFATALVSIVGVSWTLASWAPFAFMGVEINRLTAPATMTATGSRYQEVPGADPEPEPESEAVNSMSAETPTSPTFLRINHLRSTSILDIEDSDGDGDGTTGETSGVYLGILNLYTVLPQFVGTFISMIVFAIFEPGNSKILHPDGESEGAKDGLQPHDSGVNAIGICLFIGALCALGAAYATWRLKHIH